MRIFSAGRAVGVFVISRHLRPRSRRRRCRCRRRRRRRRRHKFECSARGKNLCEFASLPFSMKLFVPFATSDNGVYVSEEKRAEVVPGERAKVLARVRSTKVAPTDGDYRALTASQDTTLIIIRRLVTLVTLLSVPSRALLLRDSR